MATDKYGILPPDFLETWDADSIEEALQAAEEAPTTTDTETMPRCPYCGSTRLRPKPNNGVASGCEHRIDTDYKCNNCYGHIQKEAPSLTKAPDWVPVDDRDTRFVWETKPGLADPADRGESHELRGMDDETLTELVIRLYKPWRDDRGPSYRDLAAIVPYTREWIGSRIRAWTRGEYRDLVVKPTPTAHVEAGTVAATDGGREK